MLLRESCREKIGCEFSYALINFLIGCEQLEMDLDFNILTRMAISTNPKELVKGATEIEKVCEIVKKDDWLDAFSNRNELAELFSGAARDISALLKKEALLLQISAEKKDGQANPLELFGLIKLMSNYPRE